MLLNNEWINNEIKEEINRYLSAITYTHMHTHTLKPYHL